jgi:hypothetical protein
VTFGSTTAPDGTTVASYQVINPSSGTWTAVVTNTGSLATIAVLTTGFVSSLRFIPTVPAVVVPGATYPLSASLADGSTPLAGAAIMATVVLSGNSPLQTLLSDRGNGTYAGKVALPATASGGALVDLVATGTDQGIPFDLTATAAGQINSGQANFGSSYGEQAIDTNGNGLYDQLQITPQVTAQHTSFYQLSCDLTDANGNVIASATDALTLTAGLARPVALSFDGATNAQSGVNGSNQLRNLTLYDLNADAPTASLANAYTTASYQASQFEHAPVNIGSTVTDAGGNPTAAGLFQTLDVTSTVQVSATGSHTVGALLIDSSGAPITSTVRTVTLGTSPTPVTLHFPGSALAAHRVNGPYQVVGFTVTASDGTELADIDTLETTQAYRASQFASAIQSAAVSLAAGWNLIDLPLATTTPISASTTLQGVLHSRGGSLAAIYGLSANRWSPSLIQVGTGTPSGTDFTLQPGQGYLVYSDKIGSYLQTGTLPATQPAWTLTPGWNLVGLSLGATGPISASTVLQGVLQASNGNLAAIYGLSANRWSPSLVQVAPALPAARTSHCSRARATCSISTRARATHPARARR